VNWFTRLFYPTHDPAWHPTGLRQCFTGHDESRAKAIAAREAASAAKRRARSQRVILSTKPVKADVYVLPRRSAK
jgi:hypothetical protein